MLVEVLGQKNGTASPLVSVCVTELVVCDLHDTINDICSD